MLLAGGPKAMAVIKETVNYHAGNPHEKVKEYSIKLFDSGVVTKSEEALFGIKSFIQNVCLSIRFFSFFFLFLISLRVIYLSVADFLAFETSCMGRAVLQARDERSSKIVNLVEIIKGVYEQTMVFYSS
jgi:hypothetical protein